MALGKQKKLRGKGKIMLYFASWNLNTIVEINLKTE